MKKLLLFIPFLPSVLFAQIGFTPAAPVVVSGSSLVITADRPVTWTLTGVGSQTNTTTTLTYTAPTHTVPQAQLDGCMVLPDNSIYNTRIDALPLVASSTAWVNAALIAPFQLAYQWGTNLVTSGYPLSPLTFHYTVGLNGVGFPIPALPDKKRETGAYTTDTVADHHMLVLNRQTCRYYETYQEGIPSLPYLAASGWIYDGTSFVQPSQGAGGGATDAASMPLTPLTVHLSEIKAGVINHALRFTTCVSCFSSAFIWPANASTGVGTSVAPMGSRFRLKSTFDISTFPAAAQVVLTALKQYGMILADVGLAGQATASSDVTEDPVVTAALFQIALAHIPASNWEIVDESTLELNVTSNVVNPANAFVTPVHQAVLTVTETAHPTNIVKLPITVQSITVGTPDPTLTVEAGTQTFQIPSWVVGSANQAVTWAISPSSGAGTVDSSGNYTAPANVASVTTATLTATSAADTSASTSIALTLFPNYFTPAIDSGSPSGTTGEQYVWLQDMGFETGTFNLINDNFPTNAWGSIPFLTQYQTYMYAYGDDIVYRLHVPNGAYQVRFLLGVGNCTGTFNAVFGANSIFGITSFESQGEIALASYDFGTQNAHTCRTPASVTVPALVRDTNLLVALRAVIDGSGNHSAPLVNGLMIIPVNDPGGDCTK